MGGETEQEVSGWTVDTLNAFTRQRFNDIEKANLLAFETAKSERDALANLTRQRFEAQDRAVDKALEAIDKRLDGLNELRSMLTDAQAQFPTREATDTRFIAMEDRQRSLENRFEAQSGHSSGINSAWVYLIGAIAAIAAIAGLVSTAIALGAR